MPSMIVELAGIVRQQYSNLPLHVNAEFCSGKTFIVTGANIGLGYETTKHLVCLGSRRVILAVRSQARGEAARTAIEAETGVRGVAEVWQLDLSSNNSIIAFAGRVKQELDRVDAIIENATAANSDWVLYESWESHIMVNVLGTLLVVVLLMPHLSKCAKIYNIKPRIVVVTSGLGFTRQADLSKVDRSNILRDINNSKKWPIEGTNRYSFSKLLQILACQQLASLAPASQTGIVINLVSPGFCKTGLVRYSDAATKMQVGIMTALIGRSAEWGSRNLLHGVVVGEESHGKYLTYCKIRDDLVPEWVSNKDGRVWSKRVWEEVAAEFERVQPGCVSQAINA